MRQILFHFSGVFMLFMSFILAGCEGEKEQESTQKACPDKIEITASKLEIFEGESIDFENKTSTGTVADPEDEEGDDDSAEAEESEDVEEGDESQAIPFSWNFGDGSPEDKGNSRHIAHKFEKEGNYKVSLSYGPDCKNEISISVKARPEPEPCKEKKQTLIKASSMKIKKGETITLEEASGLGHQWEWSGGPKGGSLGSGNNLKVKFDEAGKFKVFCKINNGQDPCIIQPEGLTIEVRPVIQPPPVKKITDGKVVPVPPCPVTNAALISSYKKRLNELFSAYRKNPAISPQFKKTSEDMGFLLSDQILSAGGNAISMSDLRSEINNNEDFDYTEVAGIEVDPKECRIKKITLKKK